MPASNMRGTVSRTAGTLLVCAQISLSYTPWRARGQHGTPPITEKRYCLCAYARAALHTSALSECCAAAVALQNQGAAARGRSRRSSRLRPIGNLRPGRGGQATQTRRQQLVQDSPALPTRHGLEAQNPWRWIIIIYRGESRVGTPFQPRMQHEKVLHVVFPTLCCAS